MAEANRNNIAEGAKKIPIFYGQPGKDTITAEMFLEQAETLGRTLDWSQELLCQNIYMALGGHAKLYAQEMQEDHTFVPHIDRYKELFAKLFGTVIQQGELLANFSSLPMKKGETVSQFHLRVSQLVRKYTKSLSDMRTTRYPEEIWNSFTAAQKEASIARDRMLQHDMRAHFKAVTAHQLYVSNISAPYHEELLKLKTKTFDEAHREALLQEDRINNKKEDKFKLPINEIAAEEEDAQPAKPQEEVSTLALIYEAISKISGNSHAKPAQAHKPSKFCIYCKKKGHNQEECFKRKNAKAPCKDKNGRYYDPQPNGERKYRTSGQTSSISTCSHQDFH